MNAAQRSVWLASILTFVLAVTVNAVIFAYGYGQMSHRVESLEQQNAQLREDWKAARERIEKALLTK